jgi:hypothetical protein
MIISASRRTDIPAFYGNWFINRLQEGFVYVRNPINPKQISKIILSPQNINAIVFWTKNPKSLINKLNTIDNMGYANKYYFQFTITPYGQDIEAGITDKGKIVEMFESLSEQIGLKRVILRYDPIFLTDKYNIDFHINAFDRLVGRLRNKTEKIIISFLDQYRKVKKNMSGINIKEMVDNDIFQIAKGFSQIASKYNLSIETCAESIDLSKFSIKPAKCIDRDLIEQISGIVIADKNKKDANRKYCGCMKCVDIGQYDSCINYCLYCYANASKEKSLQNYNGHNSTEKILLNDSVCLL